MTTAEKILYYDGYKYQLAMAHTCKTDVFPPADILQPFYSIQSNGLVTARAGYAWDGPSGPTFDTKSFMRGSLIHDILYQAMASHLLSMNFREQADMELKRICLEDGMCSLRAWYVYRSVRRFGGMWNKEDKVLIAP